MKGIVQLLDLPDELLLLILKKVNPQVLLLSSMIDILNHRLKKLAFDRCHSIDLSFDYPRSKHGRLLKKFYSDVMPCISHDIRSLTINFYHMSRIKTFVENNSNDTFSNLIDLKIIFGCKRARTGIPYTLGFVMKLWLKHCEPLCTKIHQYFYLPECSIGKTLSILCSSSLMRTVQLFELDENCMLTGTLANDILRSDKVIRLTHIRISFSDFDRCVDLLNQLGSQLQSFTVNIGYISDYTSSSNSNIRSISCPNLKQMTMTIYENFSNYMRCISLLQRLSNVEYLTLLLAIDVKSTTPNHFIDRFMLERDILVYMPRLRQFHFHIRSILQNASRTTIRQIHRSFHKQQQKAFGCVVDHFKNKFGQYQIYSLPFIGTRLDFISNRFPLFDNNNTFSNVTTLLLFDDVKPFESIFFERLARALPQLKTLEIINELKQQEKTTAMKTNINFIHLTVLILRYIHMDYAEQFLYQIHLSSLIELIINKDILLRIIDENHKQARDNFSKVGTIITSKPSYELIDVIQNFFPVAHYIKHYEEEKEENDQSIEI